MLASTSAICFFRRDYFFFLRETVRAIAVSISDGQPFALYERGSELKFFAPTAPDKPWTSGSFGCVRDDGTRMHEGLDIRHLQTDRRGEPTDPVMATADGTVVYFSTKPSLSNYGNYIVIRHVVEGLEIYSLYAHLSAIRPGLKIGEAGQGRRSHRHDGPDFQRRSHHQGPRARPF